LPLFSFFKLQREYLYTVKLKISADKKICGNNICGSKMTVFLKQVAILLTRKYLPQFFIRKFFGDNGRKILLLYFIASICRV
jgi:hypothetical protein